MYGALLSPLPSLLALPLLGLSLYAVQPGHDDPGLDDPVDAARTPNVNERSFAAPDRQAADVEEGRWIAWLDCPGGELPFELQLERDAANALVVTIHNGEERIRIPKAELVDEGGPTLVLTFPHYDATIRAEISEEGRRLDGEYAKRLGPERWRRLPFHAQRAGQSTAESMRFGGGHAPAVDVGGRWRIDFSSSDDPAVGIFEQTPDGGVTGTILTSTGDYRFLAGALHGARLRLSVFDGAHAFLFDAIAREDGGMEGDFWSGDIWHESWAAVRDDEVALPDAFEATRWHDLASLSDVLLPDSNGRLRSLAEPDLRGKATLVVLFGSWCPNCHDEAPYLVELMERYGERGLRVVGLAFEFTGDLERDAAQLRRFAERHDVEYPLLLAGTADKADATLAFPGVDFVRSYPTTLFVDEGGHVRWVHSGFSGPATGEEHATLRTEFESRIERLLSEPDEGHGELERALPATPWRTDEIGGGSTFVFAEMQDGSLKAYVTPNAGGETVEHAVQLVGMDAVWIGDDPYRLDPISQALLSPVSFGKRLMPASALDSPLLIEAGYPNIRETPKALLHEDARVRREAIWSLGRRRMNAAGSSAEEFIALVADPEVEVAIAAAWAIAATGDLSAAETLGALAAHPNVRMRREVARGLVRFARMSPALKSELVPLASDPDPIVREIVGEILGQ